MAIMDHLPPVKVTVLGTDARQKELAKELQFRLSPETVHCIGSLDEQTRQTEFLILPIRGSSDFFHDNEDWLDAIYNTTKILVGKTAPAFREVCKARDLQLISYIDRDDFKIANAVPTAEGSIKLYMELSGQTVSGSRMLVIGFGHCGKALALRLASLGADVTVFARKKEDRIFGAALGLDMRDYNQLAKLARQKTCLFNTVPAPILDGSILPHLPKQSLIIDLASAPGGTDFALCKELGLTAHEAPNLPGRYFPKTAGMILADTVTSIITESCNSK